VSGSPRGRGHRTVDLDKHGFYAPGGWDAAQLATFAAEISPDNPVDLGIVRAVKTLLDAGIECFESCEGGEGHSAKEPVVRFSGKPEAGWRALAVCLTYEFPVAYLQRYWMVLDSHEPQGPWWQLVFRQKL